MKRKNKTKIYLVIVVLLSISVFSGHFLNKHGDLNNIILSEDLKGNEYDKFNNNIIKTNSSSINTQIKELERNYSFHYDKKGKCTYVIDGDTIDVEGVGRIRFVGVNTPERGEPGYKEAKDFITELCLEKTIYLDVDDEKETDKYGRVLAVLYVDGINVNQALLKLGFAEIMYIPPSEFYPYDWT